MHDLLLYNKCFNGAYDKLYVWIKTLNKEINHYKQKLKKPALI